MTLVRFLPLLSSIVILASGVGLAFGQEQKNQDKFGIAKLYPTADDGREWFSKWDNKIPRVFGNDIDPYDKEFVTKYGEGKYSIDGDGIMSVDGQFPRMYVYDPNQTKTWHNNEITFYGKRISEFEEDDWAGLQAYGRTAHIDEADICTFRGYGGQMLNNGEMKFEKEVYHHSDNGYVQSATVRPWPGEGEMPKGIWIGYKFVIYNLDENRVKLELYRDLTDGKNGGTWELMTEYVDEGGWGENASACNEGVEPAEVLTEPGLVVYIRNDGITEVDYKKFSVREISPL